MDAVPGLPLFRLVEVDHPVCLRVVCPDGRQHLEMSRAVSWIVDRQGSRSRGRRFARAALWPLNQLQASLEGRSTGFDLLNRFTRSIEECRTIQDASLAALGVPSEEGRDGSYWLKPKPALHARVSDALSGMRMMTAALTQSGVFVGQDPSKVDRTLSRTDGAPSRLDRTRRGIRLDVDARFRIGENPNHAPRYDDPRFYERLREGLAQTGASEAVRRGCGLAFSSGGRFVSVFSLDMYGLLVAANKPRHYPTRNKGDKPGERSFEMIIGAVEDDELLRYVAGERATLSGYSLDGLRLMADDPSRHGELRRMPVLTEDGLRPVSYGRLWRVFRRAAMKMDLFIDDDDYRRTRTKRWVTFHYLRHEYVHRRLDRIRTMPTEAERTAERKALLFYMRWRTEKMLDWYSRHHEAKHADLSAEAFNDEQDRLATSGLLSDVGEAPRSFAAGILEDAFG